MKKLLTLALVGVLSLISCRENDTVLDSTQNNNLSEKVVLNKTSKQAPVVWDKPSDDPYALDGYVHINLNDLTAIYMGEEAFNKIDVNSEEYKLCIDAVNNTPSQNSRQVANVVCAFQENDMNVALVNVCNRGNCRQYIVYTYDSGNQFAYEHTSNYPLLHTCGVLAFMYW